jgi:hypothetical protein
MRRMLWIAGALVALAAPAAASADVLSLYQDLSARRLSPAPLVPTVAPRVFGSLDETMDVLGSRRRSGYGFRIVHSGSGGADAVIALQAGNFSTLKAALRYDTRFFGFKAKRTRVRGRAGYLLTRPRQRALLWSEGGRVYELGSGTPGNVSLKDLRATAAGLDRLERAYVGSGGDPDLGDGAVAVTTEHTITIDVSWGANCTEGGLPATGYSGSAHPTLLRRQGARFGFDIAQFRTGEDAWAGSVSGTIGPDAIVLNMQARGVFDGATCDTGPITYALDQRPKG